MKVKEIMTSNPRTCPPDAGLQEVARKMLDCDCGAIPIMEKGKVIGMITDRDIVCRAIAEGKNPLEMKARDCMSGSCVTVSGEATIEECMDLMEKSQIRRIPVVDAQEACCGIVSQADIATKLGPSETAGVLREVSKPR